MIFKVAKRTIDLLKKSFLHKKVKTTYTINTKQINTKNLHTEDSFHHIIKIFQIKSKCCRKCV